MGLLRALRFALDVDRMVGDLFFPWLYAILFAVGTSTLCLPPFPLGYSVNLRNILRSDRVLQDVIETTIGHPTLYGFYGIRQYRAEYIVQNIARQLFNLESAFHIMNYYRYEDERLVDLVRLFSLNCLLLISKILLN